MFAAESDKGDVGVYVLHVNERAVLVWLLFTGCRVLVGPENEPPSSNIDETRGEQMCHKRKERPETIGLTRLYYAILDDNVRQQFLADDEGGRLRLDPLESALATLDPALVRKRVEPSLSIGVVRKAIHTSHRHAGPCPAYTLEGGSSSLPRTRSCASGTRSPAPRKTRSSR